MQSSYWIIHILVIIFFIGSFIFRATTVFTGNLTRFGDRKILSKWKKFWFFIGRFFKNFFSKKFWPLVLGLFLDVIFQFKLLRQRPLKWFVHALIFWGFILLFIVSAIFALISKLPPIFSYQAGMNRFVDIFSDPDNRWRALATDGLSLIIAAGIALAFIKGFAQKRKIKMFEGPDIFLICFIALMLLGGWLTEAGRFLAEGTPYYIAKFGFIGYWFSLLLKMIAAGKTAEFWTQAHNWIWHIHLVSVWLFFIYIPFSKLTHIIFSSVAGSVNSMQKRLKIKNILREAENAQS